MIAVFRSTRTGRGLPSVSFAVRKRGSSAHRLTRARPSQRSALGDQSGQDRYQIVQSAGKVRLCSGAQARSIASKSGDGTALIDVVAVGFRQIPVYVAAKSSGGLIDGGPG